MSAPIRPEPDDNWLVADARGRLNPGAGRQMGPRSPFAPADATARRTAPTPLTAENWLTNARELLRELRVPFGGLAAAVGRAPTDLLGLAALPITAAHPERGTLRTVGRGEVRWGPPEPRGRLAQGLDSLLARGERFGEGVGDAVGGTPQTADEQAARMWADFIGSNLLWWKGPSLLKEVPGAVNRARLAMEPGEAFRVAAGVPKVPKMQPFLEYQMRRELGQPIPKWLDDLLTEQEARLDRELGPNR